MSEDRQRLWSCCEEKVKMAGKYEIYVLKKLQKEKKMFQKMSELFGEMYKK